MGILLLLLFLLDLIALAFPLLALYFFREWMEYRDTTADEYALRCLIAGTGLALYTLFGKFMLPFLVSKKRKNEKEPQLFKASEYEILPRMDGSKIYIEYYGKKDAQPIIFVHGWNANRMEWFYQKRFFAEQYRVILIDLPGLGHSTRPYNKDFSLTKMANDLNAVIKHTGVVNPILWGHSIGGMIILELVTKLSKSLAQPIKGLILEHTTYTNPVKTSILSKLLTAIQKPVLEPICFFMIGLSPLVWLMRWLSFLNGNVQLTTRFLTFTGTQTYRQLNFLSLLACMAPPAVFARGMLGMFKYDVTNLLASIRIPALVIGANKDRLTKPEASEYIHQQIKGSKLVITAPGGHQGLVERHEEVNTAAAEFISSLSGKNPPKLTPEPAVQGSDTTGVEQRAVR